MKGDILLVCWDCKTMTKTNKEREVFRIQDHWGHKITLIEDMGDGGFAVNNRDLTHLQERGG